MKEKMEALAAATETSSNDPNRNSRGKNQQENDEENARIAAVTGRGDNSRDMKALAKERSKKVLTLLRSNSSLFGDEVKEGRRSSMSTAASPGEGEKEKNENSSLLLSFLIFYILCIYSFTSRYEHRKSSW